MGRVRFFNKLRLLAPFRSVKHVLVDLSAALGKLLRAGLPELLRWQVVRRDPETAKLSRLVEPEQSGDVHPQEIKHRFH